ncbi:MAG: NAD-dependent epimerase/dehydratase family protein [Elusimicrobiota bacterium]
MDILVTGGAGFIASHVADAYIALGHRVTVVDDLSTGKKANLPRRARFVRADVRSAAALRALFRKGRFQVVNHHAAQIDVRKSVADPVFDAQVNLLGLLNLLELSRLHKVRKFIFSASGGTYYGECTRPARETDEPRPLSPYGISKMAGEYYIRAYRALHGLKYTVFRYGNVYGPRQDPHGEAGVVAIFCKRMLAGQPVHIFGDGRQQRDYVFSGDVARASVLALRRGDNDVFNIGTGRAASVNDLFRILAKKLGYASRPVFQPARPGELFRSCLNAAKARKGLGWRPSRTLEQGLGETAEFFRRAP